MNTTGENELLIIFIRNLEVGKVKSRLSKDVGAKAALKIYTDLLIKVTDSASKLEKKKALFYSDFIPESDQSPNSNFIEKLQVGQSIGERMSAAFVWAFNSGYSKVVLIGTDIYQLKTDIINDAFVSLEDHDAVIGPTFDGGYYLIGLKNIETSLFEDIAWSSDTVFKQTLYNCHLKDLSVKRLKKLADIDEVEDFKFLDPKDLMNYRDLIEGEKKENLSKELIHSRI